MKTQVIRKTGTIERPEVWTTETDAIAEVVRVALERRVQKHGAGAYAGPHETLGILIEEMDELRIAVRENNAVEVWAELLDVAVAAVFGMASLHVTGHLQGSVCTLHETKFPPDR